MAFGLDRTTTRMPSFEGATGWLNSTPLSTQDLRGHVVLVDFWTYTCINWLRTFPYVRAWAEKYEANGLVVVGVHTPEFPFEHDIENVTRMVGEFKVTYPVATDNDFAVWDEFANRAWPAVYLADAEGTLRFTHFGEGRYEETERAIQELLGIDGDFVSVQAFGLEAPADWDHLETPETYVGYSRAERFASAGGGITGERHSFAAPHELKLNHWALAGEWTIRPAAAELHEAGGGIAFRFHGRDLNLVMAPPSLDSPVSFRVLLDGELPGTSHGEDIDEQGEGVLSEPRVYQLIRQPGRIEDRTFEITFLEPGAEASCFTFG
jgi:thiol-disulfide isomerase/thioredoxin